MYSDLRLDRWRQAEGSVSTEDLVLAQALFQVFGDGREGN